MNKGKISKSPNAHLFLAFSVLLSILQGLVIPPSADAAPLSWTNVTNSWHASDWRSIRTNTDGSVVVAISQGASLGYLGDFYRSRDYGVTWSYGSTTGYLAGLGIAGTGNIAIASHDSTMYRAVYSASSWTTTKLSFSVLGSGANQRCVGYGPNFNSMASSTDGTSWIAGVRDESCIYTSTDSSNTWYGVSVGSTNWGSAISGDGTVRITANSDGYLYKKTGAGSWARIISATLPTNTGWWDVACDATCTHISAAQNGTGHIYSSSNSGSTWTTGTVQTFYSDISMSLDGTKIVAAGSSEIYVSQDSGATWTAQGQSKSWVGVAISGDGTKVYAAASDGTMRKSAFLAAQGVLTVPSTSGAFGAGLNLTTSGGSGSGAVTYAYTAGTTTCSLSGSTLTANGVGTCYIIATKAADATYSETSSISTMVSFSAGVQSTLSINSTAATYGATLSLTTLGGSGTGSVSFVVNSGSCTISGSTLTPTGAGSCMVTATKAAQGNYLAANSLSTSINIAKANPTFTWLNVTKTYGDVSFLLAAPTPNTAGTFTYYSGTPLVVSLSGSTATVITQGTSLITATFTPSDTTNYTSGSTTSMTVSVSRSLLNITASSPTVSYGDAIPTITPTYSVLVNSDTSAVVIGLICSTSYTTSSIVGSLPATICSGGSASNYTISYTTGAVIIQQASQTSALVVSSITGTYGTPLSLATTGGSGSGSVTYTYAAGTTTCSLISGVLTANGAGTCLITATKAAQGNYLSAVSSQTTVSFSASAQTALVVNSISGTYGTPLSLTTTGGSSNGSVTYTHAAGTTTCSLNSGVLTANGAGTCLINATKAADTNYNLVTSVQTTVTFSASAQTALVVNSTSGTYGTPLTLTTTGGSSTGSVTYAYAAGTTTCSLVSDVLMANGAGTCLITATKAADTNYNLVSSAQTTVTFGAASQTTLTLTSTTAVYGVPLALATSVGNGSGANSFVVDSGSCTISGSTLTPTSIGTCMVTATKAAQGNYLAASTVSTAITVDRKNLTISGLTGVNKEFDHGLVATTSGTPTIVGKVGSDDVLLSGTPTFAFGTAEVGSNKSVAASGFTLTGTTAGNYTLTQPTVTANITAKAARVAATNTTVAFGATVTSGFTTSGLISPDAVGSASYTYTGTGTATPPTTVGVYTVTPSNAAFSTGLIGNYSITYDTATVTILAKYTITYNANGGLVLGGSTSNVDFVVGDAALALPTPTRANYTFTGWYTLQTNGVQVTGAYTPTAIAILWARWIQNSLYGMETNTKILTITTLSGVGNTYSANAGGGAIAIAYLADALPAGTVIDAYVLSDTSTATSLIGAGNDYVMSLVLAWVATDGTVPTTATGKAISMTVTNSSIKRGAKIYSVIGVTPTLLSTATTDGSAVISITDDPQIIIAITKPDAPTGVSATSGGNASTTVSWTAPSDGGSAITSYTATSNAGQTCTSTTTSCSVTGLTNGTSYTFTVIATNTIGTSDSSAASAAITPAAPVVVTPPVVTSPSSGGGGGGGSTYVAPTPEPTPTVDPAVAAAAAAKALADAKAAEEKAAADAKALAEKRAAEEAVLLAQIKALQEKADAESQAAAKKLQEELAASQLKAEEELKAAAALKLAEEQRIAAERAVAAKKITTVYSTTAAFKLNTTYTKRLTSYSKKIATGSTVTCIGYAKSSKTFTYAKAKVVASNQAKALCTSMKKINPTLVTKSVVYPASKAPVTTVNKKWIPVSYRVEPAVN